MQKKLKFNSINFSISPMRVLLSAFILFNFITNVLSIGQAASQSSASIHWASDTKEPAKESLFALSAHSKSSEANPSAEQTPQGMSLFDTDGSGEEDPEEDFILSNSALYTCLERQRLLMIIKFTSSYSNKTDKPPQRS